MLTTILREPKVTSSNRSFCPTNSPKPKRHFNNCHKGGKKSIHGKWTESIYLFIKLLGGSFSFVSLQLLTDRQQTAVKQADADFY